MRTAVVFFLMAALGAAKLPAERALAAREQSLHFRTPHLDLDLREQSGQLGFAAALSGFRALVADFLFIQANTAWEQTQWGRVLLLFRQMTTLQPHSLSFWEMGAWHMGWNASVAALHDPSRARIALRVKAQRECLALARDFLERGIRNNPNRPQLYEALGRLYREKYHDHARASEYFGKAAAQPGAPSYEKRFSAYELSYCEGREPEAYARLHKLYLDDENERLPTLITRLKFLEDKLAIPASHRIPDHAPNS